MFADEHVIITSNFRQASSSSVSALSGILLNIVSGGFHRRIQFVSFPFENSQNLTRSRTNSYVSFSPENSITLSRKFDFFKL